MNIRKLLLFFIAGLCVTGLVTATAIIADDDDDHDERHERHERHHDEDHERNSRKNKKGEYRQTRRFLPPVDNALYKEECASCHFLYLPGLLPAKAWENIINDSEDHFGEDLALDEATSADLIAYLKANGAETTGAKRSIRIMRSLGSTVPESITTTPYIIQKHRGIKAKVLKREAIGTISNCGACHRTADRGIFEEDDITIPK
ncbi:MAG: cytochrome C [Deltaproteobacteria bacterium]|nr:cytochrome C [Deltaproteobacteria bacterium]